MSNIAPLFETFFGLLAIWAGGVLLCLAVWPPPVWPPWKTASVVMPSMRHQNITPPYEAKKVEKQDAPSL